MRLLPIFSILSIIFSAPTKAITINIENNTIEFINKLASRALDNNTYEKIHEQYDISKISLKITNQNEDIIQQKLYSPRLYLKANTSNLTVTHLNKKISAEIDLPKNWITTSIELICNNITYTFPLNDQQINILKNKNITFFFDYIIMNPSNAEPYLKLRPQILIA